MNIDINTLFTIFTFSLFIKVILLLLIGALFIFTIVLFNHIRSLKRVVHVRGGGTEIIYVIAIIYLLSPLALFIITLAIL